MMLVVLVCWLVLAAESLLRWCGVWRWIYTCVCILSSAQLALARSFASFSFRPVSWAVCKPSITTEIISCNYHFFFKEFWQVLILSQQAPCHAANLKRAALLLWTHAAPRFNHSISCFSVLALANWFETCSAKPAPVATQPHSHSRTAAAPRPQYAVAQPLRRTAAATQPQPQPQPHHRSRAAIAAQPQQAAAQPTYSRTDPSHTAVTT